MLTSVNIAQLRLNPINGLTQIRVRGELVTLPYIDGMQVMYSIAQNFSLATFFVHNMHQKTALDDIGYELLLNTKPKAVLDYLAKLSKAVTQTVPANWPDPSLDTAQDTQTWLKDYLGYVLKSDKPLALQRAIALFEGIDIEPFNFIVAKRLKAGGFNFEAVYLCPYQRLTQDLHTLHNFRYAWYITDTAKLTAFISALVEMQSTDGFILDSHVPYFVSWLSGIFGEPVYNRVKLLNELENYKNG